MTGRAAQGVSVINVAPGDSVASLATIEMGGNGGPAGDEPEPEQPPLAGIDDTAPGKKRPRRSPSPSRAAAPPHAWPPRAQPRLPRRSVRPQSPHRNRPPRRSPPRRSPPPRPRRSPSLANPPRNPPRTRWHRRRSPNQKADASVASGRPQAEMPEELVRYLEGGRLVVAATVDAEGAPYTMVMNSALAIDPHTIRFALDHRTHTLVNLRANPRIMFEVVADGMIYGVRGTAAHRPRADGARPHRQRPRRSRRRARQARPPTRRHRRRPLLPLGRPRPLHDPRRTPHVRRAPHLPGLGLMWRGSMNYPDSAYGKRLSSPDRRGESDFGSPPRRTVPLPRQAEAQSPLVWFAEFPKTTVGAWNSSFRVRS